MEMLFLSIRVCFMLCCFIRIIGWKDDWLLKWEDDAIKFINEHPEAPGYDSRDCSDCPVTIPIYSRATILSNKTQVIPRAIWQTFKSVSVNPAQCQVITDLILKNPEYDYYFFDDDNALSFICTFYPDLALLYQQVVPSSLKAAIWRLAIIYKYGGVYVDIDTFITTSFEEFIWPNASIVSGLEPSGSFHSWLLIYVPRHPIIGTALKKLTNRLKRLYIRIKTSSTTSATSTILQFTSSSILYITMKEIFHMYQCTVYSHDYRYIHSEGVTGKVISLPQSESCTEGLGVMQIFHEDNLGDHVLFRDIDEDRRKHQVDLYHGSVVAQHIALFQHIDVHIAGRSTWKIGMCIIDRQ